MYACDLSTWEGEVRGSLKASDPCPGYIASSCFKINTIKPHKRILSRIIRTWFQVSAKNKGFFPLQCATFSSPLLSFLPVLSRHKLARYNAKRCICYPDFLPQVKKTNPGHSGRNHLYTIKDIGLLGLMKEHLPFDGHHI